MMMHIAGCDVQGAVLRDRDAAAGTDAARNDVPDVPMVTAEDLVAGAFHNCLLRRGRAECWGENSIGALGIGDTAPRMIPTQVESLLGGMQASGGSLFTCARDVFNAAWCWGNNASGQLGGGSRVGSLFPMQVPGLSMVRTVASGFDHACAIVGAGELWCWGSNDEGQLGQDDPFPGMGVDRLSPVRVGSNSDWSAVAAGDGTTCAIRGLGQLYCWGRNVDGQAGVGPGTPGQFRAPMRVGIDEDWRSVVMGQDHGCGLRVDRSLWCWGPDYAGQLGLGSVGTIYRSPVRIGSDNDWIQVSLNTFSTCGVRASGTLWCWGRNDEGQLGVGDNSLRTTPTQVGSDTDWIQVAVGRFHHCARKRDGSVWCAGENVNGELGINNRERRNVMTRVVGVAP